MVFDLDGTLIDSSLDLCRSVNAALAHVGVPELPHSIITTFVGEGAATLVRRALAYQADASFASADRALEQVFPLAFEHFLAFYREHKLDNTRPYDGVLSSLDAIRRCRPDLLMAVLTNKPVVPSRAICEGLNLSRFFFANYGGDSFASKKPDPLGLHTLMQEARAIWRDRGVPEQELVPEGVFMVGDSDVDILTARKAKVSSLGCRYGLAPDRLETARPDLMCDSAQQWPELLQVC